MDETKDSLRTIFNAAAELEDAADRAAYLDRVCGGDAHLRQSIEKLLQAHGAAGSFFGGETEGTVLLPVTQQPGDRIGRYKLLQKIGEGGCGVVYMAEQEEPVRRRVALKIIKLGMDTRQVIARFEAERQALAMMDHPNIAKVLDVGSTDAGRPYFVMELVRGVRITEYCDENNLSTRERLDLFVQVCQAVQHAHQKGIIHRDLKPSNILVTVNDDVAIPKVIDFGVAKATGQQRLTDKTLFTAFEQFIGTPTYMSPEQALMTSLDIDTRSDIYSLGVLLYEMLTGKTPFDAKELMAVGLDEMRRTIREHEPARPSTRLSTMLEGELTTTARHRQSDALKLINLLRGDLDWIVMKCLEKDRTRRYETANGLAADVRRHLNNEPVVARPPSTAYRFQKAFRRNKLVFTAVSAVACALLLGVVVSTWQAVRATNAERAEKVQAERARADRDRAVLAEATARRNAYAAEINAAFQALAENNLGRAMDLLNRQQPKPGEEDLRGFEWRLLWQRCQPDEKVTFGDAGGYGLAFSPDGRWLAYAGDRIVVRELPSQSEVKTIPHAATTLAFSPRGKLLASGHDSQVRLWSTASWQEVRSLPDARYPAVFSPDGKWLVTGTADGYKDHLLRFGINPDGQTNAVGGYLVWDTETWERAGFCAGEPTFPYQSRHAVAFSQDGRLLVTAGHPKGREVSQFQVWDFPSLTVRTNFASFPFKLGSAAFAPDGKYLLMGDEVGGLMVWDVVEGRVVDKLHEHRGGITAITYARDGQTFATASYDRTLVLWDAVTRKALVRLRGHLGEVGSVAISPDGRTLASGAAFEGTTKLWDASTRHERHMLPGSGLITGFSADSRRLVVAGLKECRVWHPTDGTIRTVPLQNYPQLHDRGVSTCRDVYGSEPYGVFGLTNGMLELWNLATMSLVTSWRAYEGEVATAAFSPDGQSIVTSGEKGDIKMWETKTHLEISRFPPLGEKLVCLIFSPDGRLLASSTQNPRQAGSTENNHKRIHVWDVHEGRLLLELDAANAPSLAFSPDGKLLATAHWDNTARLWEIPSGHLKATLKGHVQAVMGVAFSPDGKTLATGGDDQKVKLWNIATQQEMATLELLLGGCRSIRFSPDGHTLAVGSFLDPGPYMWLWQVPSFEEIAAKEARNRTVVKQP